MMQDVAFLTRELPLFKVVQEPIVDRKAVALSLGYGDIGRRQVVAFADVREAWSELISTPYKNEAWESIMRGYPLGLESQSG